MRINHNISALNTYNKMTVNQSAATKSMEKLSSGQRINRAGDDAAGLAISEKMRGQIRGLEQAATNAQDGISLIQTAEGALNETHAILQRMRELSVQAANDTNTNDDRTQLQNEVDQLASEITRISEDTTFNTSKLLDGNFEGKFHIGADAGQDISIEIEKMDSHTLGLSGSVVKDGLVITNDKGEEFELKITTAATAQTGSTVAYDKDKKELTITLATKNDNGQFVANGDPAAEVVKDIETDLKGHGFSISIQEGKETTEVTTTEKNMKSTVGINISDQQSASDAITSLDKAINSVSAERAKMGAVQNRLEHTINNLSTSAENLTAAESRIRDVDMAKEMMEMTKNNILQQAAQSMLAQANQNPQNVLQLLR